jgi:hypothetical protein
VVDTTPVLASATLDARVRRFFRDGERDLGVTARLVHRGFEVTHGRRRVRVGFEFVAGAAADAARSTLASGAAPEALPHLAHLEVEGDRLLALEGWDLVSAEARTQSGLMTLLGMPVWKEPHEEAERRMAALVALSAKPDKRAAWEAARASVPAPEGLEELLEGGAL